MIKGIKILCVSALMLATVTANAIYIEPYLGLYSKGTGKQEVPANTSLNADYESTGNFALGLRAGYSLLGFSFGLEYQMGNLTQKTLATSAESKIKISNIGAFGGFDVPVIPIRGYVGYIFSASAESESSGSTIKGNGTKLGVAFTGLPFIHINLEYIMTKYNEASPALASAFETNSKTVMLAVSSPWNL